MPSNLLLAGWISKRSPSCQTFPCAVARWRSIFLLYMRMSSCPLLYKGHDTTFVPAQHYGICDFRKNSILDKNNLKWGIQHIIQRRETSQTSSSLRLWLTLFVIWSYSEHFIYRYYVMFSFFCEASVIEELISRQSVGRNEKKVQVHFLCWASKSVRTCKMTSFRTP